MQIKLMVTIPSNAAYRTLLSYLYSERKRLNDHSDHARAHGDFYGSEMMPTIDSLIDGLEYGALIEGERGPLVDISEDDALASLRGRVADADNES